MLQQSRRRHLSYRLTVQSQGQSCSWRTSLVYNSTDKGQPAHYYNIGNDTGLARRQYGGAIGIVLVVPLVAGNPPCVLRLLVALLILAG